MLRIIGLSDLEYSFFTDEYSIMIDEFDNNSNSITIKRKKFELSYYDDHIAIEFPDQEIIVTIMKCDFWRIEIE